MGSIAAGDPAVSGVRRRRSRAPPGGSRRRRVMLKRPELTRAPLAVGAPERQCMWHGLVGDPAVSGVRRRRSRAPPGGSRRRRVSSGRLERERCRPTLRSEPPSSPPRERRELGRDRYSPSPKETRPAAETCARSSIGTARFELATPRSQSECATRLCHRTSAPAAPQLSTVIGTARFELATPRSQSECATRLRHVPCSECRGAAGESRSEESRTFRRNLSAKCKRPFLQRFSELFCGKLENLRFSAAIFRQDVR